MFQFSGKHDIKCRSLVCSVLFTLLFKYGISEILWYLSMLNWCCTYSRDNWWRLCQQALMCRGPRPKMAVSSILCNRHLINPHQQLCLGGPVETYTTTTPVDSVPNCLHKTHLSIVIWSLNALPCVRLYKLLYVFSHVCNSHNLKAGVGLLMSLGQRVINFPLRWLYVKWYIKGF